MRPGGYRILVSPGYFSASNYVREWYDNKTDKADATVVLPGREIDGNRVLYQLGPAALTGGTELAGSGDGNRHRNILVRYGM